jgi:inner membrane transporter RhtA
MTASLSERPGAALLPASLTLLAAQLSGNLGSAVAKHLFSAVGVEGVTAYRVGFSALLLLALFRPWRGPLNRADLFNLAIYGAGMGLMNLMIYRAFSLIPIGVAVAIEVTGPLAVAILGSRRPRDFAAVACAVFGLYLLLPLRAGAAHLDPHGIAYAFGAGLCWAVYIIFGKRASSLAGGRAASLGLLVAACFTVPVGIGYAGASLLNPALMLSGLALAVLSSALPYSLEISALRRLPQGVFGILSSAAPAVAALMGLVVLGERLDTTQWIAIGFIVLASAVYALSKTR